ncbi:hypothetical protein EVJ32_09555 [Exiguobacterium sp. SH5S4]|uniref:hypothetical protein n=1 Tax=Exiguobacterium sp. SH5S4 TaxID=2510961 RepID=UPI00103B7523|nr:hypothetical protein [Exiguobacterium sp. SH5S4]TCI25560.1 hypothetical protein EVJ32_09555 [Exiguobacterium sp. SH5S4]
MNDLEKDAIAEISRQVMEAARLLRDAAVRLWNILIEQARIAFNRLLISSERAERIRKRKRPTYIQLPPKSKRLDLNATRHQNGNSMKIERAHQTNQRHPALRRIGGTRHGKG